jgi:uncharacterized protein involved in exopolysaccharide biosynthesis
VAEESSYDAVAGPAAQPGSGVDPLMRGDAMRPVTWGATSTDDTVSLRELYLVLRAGLPLIAAVALVCGIGAFVYKAMQGSTFTSSAVVQVVQPRVSAQPGASLDVNVSSVLTSGTYFAIAQSPAALDALATRLGLESVEELPNIEVTAGPGPSSGDALTVSHRVTVPSSRGAEWAATVANAWAEETVEMARDLLVAPFTEAGGRLTADVAAREAAYQAASEAWADFLAVDEREELRHRLESLVELDASRLERLGQMEAEASALRARIASLQQSGQPVAALAADLAAVEAGAQHVRDELAASGSQADELRSRLGELERQAAELQRRVSTTSLAYFRAAPAAAELDLRRELAAGAVSVAIPAAAAPKPDPKSTAVTAVAAVVVGGLAATVFVFLRAAVREP